MTNAYDSVLRRSSLVVRSNATALFTHSYGYDSASRLTNVSDGTYSVAYSYLANSPLVSQVSFQHGGTVRMTTTKQYDYLNRLQSISSMASNTTSSAYEYNGVNQRTRRIEGDGSLWVYGYDGLGQVTSGKKYWSDWTPVAGQQFEYAFDDIGNRNSTKLGGDSIGAALRIANYTNNNVNQITSRDVSGTVDILGVAKATATTTVNGQSTYRRGEYYQKALSLDNSSAAIYPSITNQAVLTAETNTVIGNIFLPKTQETFAYDADGNLTNDGRWMLTWDAENRLILMESFANAPDASKRRLEFAYDWRSRRISKKVSTWVASNYVPQSTNKFIYDDWNLMADLNTANGVICSYVWGTDLSGTFQGAGGVGGLLAVNSTTGAVHFVVFDGNGNVSALINATNGATSGNYVYGPFGEIIRASGIAANACAFRFSTKYMDAESDFLYYGYRYNNPSLGRWLSRDVIGEEGGMNLYASAVNNPIVFADFLGLDLMGDWLIAGPKKILALDKTYPSSQINRYTYLGEGGICRWQVTGKVKLNGPGTEKSISVYPTGESQSKDDSTVKVSLTSGQEYTKQITVIRPKFITRWPVYGPRWGAVYDYVFWGVVWNVRIDDQFNEPIPRVFVNENVPILALTGGAPTNEDGLVEDRYKYTFVGKAAVLNLAHGFAVGNWTATLHSSIYASGSWITNLRGVFH